MMLPNNILIINWICELQANREPGIGILITDHLQIKNFNMIIIRYKYTQISVFNSCICINQSIDKYSSKKGYTRKLSINIFTTQKAIKSTPIFLTHWNFIHMFALIPSQMWTAEQITHFLMHFLSLLLYEKKRRDREKKNEEKEEKEKKNGKSRTETEIKVCRRYLTWTSLHHNPSF